MTLKLFPFRTRKSPAEPKAAVAKGQRVYAIGDIHGRLDLLEALLADIREDDARRPSANTVIVFLGDLIDRGPSSRRVVERAIEIKRELPNTRFLLGNHEEVFLIAMSGDLKALAFFTRIGGRETILSYGISEAEYESLDYPGLLERMLEVVPRAHIDFLQGFEDLLIFEDYAFVHAGIRPGIPLAQQRSNDLRWIREGFLSHKGAHEKVVVHGHTISRDVELLPNRIGLDTGAYASGKLTAMGFEGDDRWILQAIEPV